MYTVYLNYMNTAVVALACFALSLCAWLSYSISQLHSWSGFSIGV